MTQIRRRALATARGALFCLLALAFSGLANATQTASAEDLVKSAQRAVGQVARAAQDDPALQPGDAKSKPFWDALKSLNEALDKTGTGLILKDATFHSSLASVSALARQAEVAYRMNDSEDPHVAEGINALSGIVQALDENYSAEAARLKQGGDLTPSERQQLEKLKQQQKELLNKLDTVEKNAAKNNEEMKKAIEEMRRQSRRISDARWGVGDFVGSMIAMRIISDWMWGWHWWWGPWGGWCPGWIGISIDIWDVWIDVYDYDWAIVDLEIDIAELELHDIDIDEFELLETESWLEDGDFGLGEGDLEALSADIDIGWEDVDSDIGAEIMDDFATNFEQVPYEEEFSIETFDDYGIDDLGGAFESFDLDFAW